jgi:heme A synthase
VLYEHGHRLAAMTVGLLQIALTIVLWFRRPGLRRLAWILLGLVVAQGVLGAITVGFKLPWYVSTGHLLLGMSYFATLIYTAFRTRPAPSATETGAETGAETELARHARRCDQLGSGRPHAARYSSSSCSVRWSATSARRWCASACRPARGVASGGRRRGCKISI